VRPETSTSTRTLRAEEHASGAATVSPPASGFADEKIEPSASRM
jgi:hypothetical protein